MNNKSLIPSKYEGWIVSLVLHGLLSILFILIVYDSPIEISEYSNLTFSTYSPVDLPVIEKNELSSAPPSPTVTTAARTSQPTTLPVIAKRKVDLPARRMTEHDLNRIPIENQGKLTNSAQRDRIDTKTETIHGVNNDLSSLDEQTINAAKPGNKPLNKSVGEKIDIATIAGQKGGDIKFDKPYEISWEGVNRDVLYDPLPKYPEGLDKEAVIKIKITVLPNGTIGDLIPLQKADATLESVTMKSLKMWKLSPLKTSDPQINQTAVIAFRYILQ